MGRHIKRGEGWRIGWDDGAEIYRGLIGGDRWSIELTDAEFKDFCRLIQELDAAVHQISSELMDSEKISCETESEYIWLEADGYPGAYELHVMIQTGRRTEGEWLPSAVPNLIAACRSVQYGSSSHFESHVENHSRTD
ncbi:MAG: DUF1818 family protein [Cyanobacteria bacterium J06633_2]